jgi:uncharacterized protein GlcG (DUF336 family)
MEDTPPTAFTGAITLAAAQRGIAAGIATAASLGVAVSLAVVDAGGVLKAFARMDGAEIAGEVLAVDKAYTAVAHRAATADLAPLAEPGGELFGLHASGHGRYVLFAGGLPVLIGGVGGVAVGGVGVSGGSAAQDVACAEAALAALLAEI